MKFKVCKITTSFCLWLIQQVNTWKSTLLHWNKNPIQGINNPDYWWKMFRCFRGENHGTTIYKITDFRQMYCVLSIYHHITSRFHLTEMLHAPDVYYLQQSVRMPYHVTWLTAGCNQQLATRIYYSRVKLLLYCTNFGVTMTLLLGVVFIGFFCLCSRIFTGTLIRFYVLLPSVITAELDELFISAFWVVILSWR